MEPVIEALRSTATQVKDFADDLIEDADNARRLVEDKVKEGLEKPTELLDHLAESNFYRTEVLHVILQTCYYTLTILIMYFGSTVFLWPYYSITHGEQLYEKPANHSLVTDDYLFFIKVTNNSTRMFSLNDEIQFMIYYGFRADYVDIDGDIACPPDFENMSLHWDDSFPCHEVHTQGWEFIPVTANEAAISSVYQGLGANFENIFQGEFHIDIPKGQSYNTIDFQFFVDLIGYDVQHPNCESDEDCIDFAELLTNHSLAYYNDTLTCHDSPIKNTKMCGAKMKTGAQVECFGSNSPDCLFTITLSAFISPAKIFTAFGLWQWGNMAFFGTYFFWSFFALVQAKILHNQYLRLYYFSSNNLVLEKGQQYDYHLEIIGKPYTKWRGKFFLRSPEGVIHEKHLLLVFPDADQEDDKTSMVELDGHFTPTKTHIEVEFGISWDNFNTMESPGPLAVVKINHKLPSLVRTRWNVLFILFFWLKSLITGNPSRKEFIKYPLYLLLVLHVTSIHMCWWIQVVFLGLAFSQNAPDEYWGTVTDRPVFPVLFYVIFEIFQFSSLMTSNIARILISKSRKTREKQILLDNGTLTRAPLEEEQYLHELQQQISISLKRKKPLLVPTTSRATVFTDQSELGQDFAAMEVLPLQNFSQREESSSDEEQEDNWDADEIAARKSKEYSMDDSILERPTRLLKKSFLGLFD